MDPTIMRLCSFKLSLLCGLLATAFLTVQAQPSSEEIQQASAAFNEVPVLLQQRDFAGALERIEKGLPVFEDMLSTSPAFAASVERGRFFRAVCLLELSKYDEAADAFETYLRNHPKTPSSAEAAIRYGECLWYLGQWKRIVEEVPEIAQAYDLNRSQVLMIHRMLGEAYINTEEWDKAMRHFNWMFNNSYDIEDKQVAVASICVCMVKKGDYEELYKSIPFVLRTPARYDIILNFNFLETGQDLMADGDIAQAVLLLRLVTPYAELKKQNAKEISQKEKRIQQIEAMPNPSQQIIAAHRRFKKDLASLNLRKEELENTEDYDQSLRILLGRCYVDLGRFEEAMQLYLSVAKDFPGHEGAETAVYLAWNTAQVNGQFQRAIDIANLYIESFPQGKYFGDITLYTAAMLAESARWFEVVEIVDTSLATMPDHPAIDRMLLYKMSAQFEMDDLPSSQETAARIVSDHPRSSYVVNAKYSHALAHLFQENFADARDEFQHIVDTYQAGVPVRQDSRYRLAICHYGLGDFDTAQTSLEGFLEEYPTTTAKAQALAMIGDIQASRGDLDTALATYDSAVTNAINMVQADYATFQQARTLELEGKWEEILKLFEVYHARFPGGANFTESTYWQGNALKQLGRHTEALNKFFDTIIEHGDDPRAYGLDFILRDLILELKQLERGGATNVELREEMRAFRDRLYEANKTAAADDKPTLKLRLTGLMVETTENEGVKRTLSRSLLSTNNIPHAAPVTLVTMGRLASEGGNDELALKIYEHFLAEYDDSDLILDALVGLADARMKEEKYPEALDLLTTIASKFAASEEAAGAILSMGDVYRKMGEYDKALESYATVLSVREWRGPDWPLALIRSGDTFMDQAKWSEAIPYYARVCINYAGYTEQAAEAFLKRAQCLKKTGKILEMEKILNQMLDNPALAQTPEAFEAKKLLLK